MNKEKILDNVLYIMLILSGLLCLVASGKDIARTITEISAGEYWIALFDAFCAIWLFALGFRNIKAAWKYIKVKFCK
jgi:predicted membrane protein